MRTLLKQIKIERRTIMENNEVQNVQTEATGLQKVLGGILGFVKKHGKKLLLSGLAVGGAVLAVKAIKNKKAETEYDDEDVEYEEIDEDEE